MPEAKPITYQRLPGTGYKNLFPRWAVVLLFFAINVFVLFLRGRRVRLWTGPDHLLLVESDGFNEYYKRYFYRDIQGVVIRRTREAGIVNLVLGVAAVAVFSLLMSGSQPADFFGLILGFLVLFLIINVVKGPTCLCQLRTAVNTVTLPSLGRLRNAHRALAQLRPLITAAQGELTLAEIQAKMQPPAAPVQLAEPPIATTPAPAPLAEPDLPPRITS